jgi:hypothetical protein
VERLLERAASTTLAPPSAPWRRRLAIGLPIAASLLLVLVATSRLADRPAAVGAFRTLSDPPRTAVALPERGVRLVFVPTTTEATMREILLSVRGRIVSGPSPLGAYTVELAAGADADPLSVVLEHLRARPEVRFAEPLSATP